MQVTTDHTQLPNRSTREAFQRKADELFNNEDELARLVSQVHISPDRRDLAGEIEDEVRGESVVQRDIWSVQARQRTQQYQHITRKHSFAPCLSYELLKQKGCRHLGDELRKGPVLLAQYLEERASCCEHVAVKGGVLVGISLGAWKGGQVGAWGGGKIGCFIGQPWLGAKVGALTGGLGGAASGGYLAAGASAYLLNIGKRYRTWKMELSFQPMQEIFVEQLCINVEQTDDNPLNSYFDVCSSELLCHPVEDATGIREYAEGDEAREDVVDNWLVMAGLCARMGSLLTEDAQTARDLKMYEVESVLRVLAHAQVEEKSRFIGLASEQAVDMLGSDELTHEEFSRLLGFITTLSDVNEDGNRGLQRYSISNVKRGII